MEKSTVLDSICEYSISDGFNEIDEDELSSSWRFGNTLSSVLEGSFVELFRSI